MNNNFEAPILPPATIGIVGGGQLGRMLAISAKTMGYQVGILDPTPNSPAGQVADFQITADYQDMPALKELAKRCAVLTYEFENVDEVALKAVQESTLLPQGTALLRLTSNRLTEKKFLHSQGIPVTPFAEVSDEVSLVAAIQRIGTPAILKTSVGGYDGHGQVDVMTSSLTAEMRTLVAQSCILEARQSFTLEASMMVTRSATGQIVTFPLVENQHQHHILRTTIAPARVDLAVQHRASEIATKIASVLELRGVLGIEFFVLANGQLLVNELAPRPHNSGHYTIEACNISQFEAHIRSICGLPIPTVTQHSSAVMRNLLGTDLITARRALAQHPEWHFHDYGKDEVKVQRKMGHVTVLNSDIDAALASLQELKGEG